MNRHCVSLAIDQPFSTDLCLTFELLGGNLRLIDWF